MIYQNTVYGTFIKRVNRFIAEVQLDGKEEMVHIKNTGRLRELLLPGADVLLEPSRNPNRKTAYSLIAVRKDDRWINIDSLAPNAAVFEALQNGKVDGFKNLDIVRKEVTYGASRMDFSWEKDAEKGFIEVKGVTLEKDGIAMFPDAPTKRGTKHVLELISALESGYHAALLFVIQMKGVHLFTPHYEMDPSFAESIEQAAASGVRIFAYDSIVTEKKLTLDEPVSVRL